MSRWWLLGIAAVVSCGEETSGPEPPGEAACGVAGTPAAGGCASLADCGTPGGNVRTVSFCEDCLASAQTHACEAGACRPLGADGSMGVEIRVPEAVAGAKGFTVASLAPVMADGTRITCAKLKTATCATKDSPLFNARNSVERSFPGGGADPSQGYRFPFLAESGEGRILFVTITREARGAGGRVAVGCAEGITVPAGATVDVALTIEAL